MSKIKEAIQENMKKTSALCLMLTDNTATSYDVIKHVEECEDRLMQAFMEDTEVISSSYHKRSAQLKNEDVRYYWQSGWMEAFARIQDHAYEHCPFLDDEDTKQKVRTSITNTNETKKS